MRSELPITFDTADVESVGETNDMIYECSITIDTADVEAAVMSLKQM